MPTEAVRRLSRILAVSLTFALKQQKGTQLVLTGGSGWAILPLIPRQARVASGGPENELRALFCPEVRSIHIPGRSINALTRMLHERIHHGGTETQRKTTCVTKGGCLMLTVCSRGTDRLFRETDR